MAIPGSNRYLSGRKALKSTVTGVLAGCFCALVHALPAKVVVVDAENRPVADVAVVISGPATEVDASQPLDTKVVGYQRGKRFEPYVQTAMVGQPVYFVNSDSITHHIYSLTGNEPFSLNLGKGEASEEMQFFDTGAIAMGCNVHDWMSGYLVIVDSTVNGVTDSQGQLLVDVEPGNYTLSIWHPALGYKDAGAWAVEASSSTQRTIRIRKSLSSGDPQKNFNDFDFLQDY